MNRGWQETATGFLFTDQYQLSMAQLYYRMNLHERPAHFDHFFRTTPNYGTHQAGYCINAGLEWLVDWMCETVCTDQDIDYLRSQRNRRGEAMFQEDFLAWLRKNGHFKEVSLRAIPEGRVVHANVPMTMVYGPLAIVQILETPLLNLLNYQTLIATKASRISLSGRGQPVLEFGLRRGQERGSNAGARAALIGGADFTSNVGISHLLGYPPKGTHAHSMVQAFMALGQGELDAFRAYAAVYPDDCLLLVDTIDTLNSGVPNAITVFEELRQQGHQPVGIRLDSGDLAHLAIQSARMLDEAGFPETRIVLSNQLDELVILQILTQIQEEAGHYGVDADRLIKRLIYGVGTSLLTSNGHPALDGVYKLVAVKEDGKWAPTTKVSETPLKILNPGAKETWRIYDQRGMATADLIGLQDENPAAQETLTLRHPGIASKSRTLTRSEFSQVECLHVDVFLDGKLVYELPTLEAIRRQRDADLQKLDPGVRRIINPHIYHVSLTPKLWDLKQKMIENARGVRQEQTEAQDARSNQ